MKKRMINVALSIMIILLAALATGCGDGMKGTWYYINGASETNYMNLTFQGNNEVENTGLIGSYEVNGDTVTVNFLGLQQSYEKAEYNGESVLMQNERPVYAKTLEGAEKISAE